MIEPIPGMAACWFIGESAGPPWGLGIHLGPRHLYLVDSGDIEHPRLSVFANVRLKRASERGERDRDGGLRAIDLDAFHHSQFDDVAAEFWVHDPSKYGHDPVDQCLRRVAVDQCCRIIFVHCGSS